YDKLLAAAGQPAAAGSAGPGPQPPGKADDRLPRNWDELGPNHMVIAHESADEGWYEAVVVERHGDMLTLRWRDYPRQRGVTRHRLSVALLYPNDQAAPAATATAPTATAKSQTNKAPSSKASPADPATAPAAFPQTWGAIGPNH